MNRNYTFCLWYIYFISLREVTLLAFLSLKFKELEKYITYVTYIVTSITHKPTIGKFWNFQRKKVQYLRFILDMYTMLITRGIYYMHFVTKSDTKKWKYFDVISKFEVDWEVFKKFETFFEIYFIITCVVFTLIDIKFVDFDTYLCSKHTFIEYERCCILCKKMCIIQKMKSR